MIMKTLGHKTFLYCEQCDFSTHSKQYWVYHITKSRKHNNIQPVFYNCEICDIRWPWKGKYDTHIQTHKHKVKVWEKRIQEIGTNFSELP